MMMVLFQQLEFFIGKRLTDYLNSTHLTDRRFDLLILIGVLIFVWVYGNQG
jgi:hypothetical protein